MTENDDHIQFSEESLEELYDIAFDNLDSEEDAVCPLFISLEEINSRYTDHELIAEGGMKRVFKVLDAKANRHVAMATLHDDAPIDLYDPFIREARLTALLEHPNIISIHDIGANDSGHPFFTMELIVGDSLNSILEKMTAKDPHYKRLYTRERLLNIFIKICDAISFAHSKGVIHLDLKPSNIQVGEFGEVIVCDWGLGKVMEYMEIEENYDALLLNPDFLNNITLSGNIKGTPGFMAPEQIVRNGEKDEQTDIYSLGAILYTILTLDAPFTGELDTILSKTEKGDLIPPIKRRPNLMIPKSLDAVVVKAMQLKKSDRYETVERLKNDVESYLSGRSTMAEEAGFFKEFSLFYKRNKTVCIITLLFLVSFISLSSIFIYHLSKNMNDVKLARDEANRNLAISNKEKEKAEMALSLYQQEKEWGSVIVQTNPELMKEQIYFYTDWLAFMAPEEAMQKALSFLNRLIENKPDMKWAYMQRGYVYFVMQEYQLAIDNWSIESGVSEDLFQISKEYNTKISPNKCLPLEIFIDVINKLKIKKNYRSRLPVILLKYDSVKRQSKQDHAKAVELILRQYNNKWQGQMDYEHLEQKLKITGALVNLAVDGKNFTSWGPPLEGFISIIEGLDVKHLDLSYTSFFELRQIQMLPIESLDIRGTKVKKLDTIQNMTNLRTLVVSPDVFKKDQLADLPNNVTLIME